MKTKITLLALLLNIVCAAQCPSEGNGKNAKEIAANKLKNRNILPPSKLAYDGIGTFVGTETPIGSTDTVTLEKVLRPGEDHARFNTNAYVKITGYLVEVKAGGKESCNCESAIDSLNDIHIYIGQTPNAEKKDCMIVEITPRFKRINHGLNLSLMKGKEVNVYGYLFYDEEHKGNAANTCHTCTNTWRKTCWEIHPVCKIELSDQ